MCAPPAAGRSSSARTCVGWMLPSTVRNILNVPRTPPARGRARWWGVGRLERCGGQRMEGGGLSRTAPAHKVNHGRAARMAANAHLCASWHYSISPYRYTHPPTHPRRTYTETCLFPARARTPPSCRSTCATPRDGPHSVRPPPLLPRPSSTIQVAQPPPAPPSPFPPPTSFPLQSPACRAPPGAPTLDGLGHHGLQHAVHGGQELDVEGDVERGRRPVGA